MESLAGALPLGVVGAPFLYWDLVNVWAARSAVFCALCTGVVWPAVLSAVAPTFVINVPEGKRISSAMDMTQFFVALTSTLLVWPEVFAAQTLATARPAGAIYLPAGPGVASGCGMLFGYFLVHLVQLLWWGAKTRPTMGAYWYITFGHHGISLLIWPLGLYTNTYIYFIGWYVFSEASNIFLDIQTVLGNVRGCEASKANVEIPFYASSFLFVVSFVVTRLIPTVSMVWVLFSADMAKMDMALRVLGWTTVPLPWVLNLYWGAEIVKEVLKVLGCGGGASSQKGD